MIDAAAMAADADTLGRAPPIPATWRDAAMTELKPFPHVDPGEIEVAGHRFQQAADELSTATSYVRSAAGTTSWRSPGTRPAWDATLDARGADIGNVLRTTGAELARCKSDYQAAQLNIL